MSEHPSTFVALGVIDQLAERLGEIEITTPTPIQEQAIPPLIEGRDLLGLAQTGTGKTAAYLLPLIQKIMAQKEAGEKRKAPAALILAPTRELAHQVATSIKAFSQGMGIRYLVVCGGERYDGQINALKKGVDILVATPGRFEDLFKRGVIDLGHVAHLVLDEADQMIDLGFYPAIRRICNAITAPHQTIFFSATMPHEMHELSREFLTDSVTIKIKNRNITADTVEQRAYLVADAGKRDALCDLIMETKGEQVLVFVGTKRQADTLSSYLHARELRVDVLHGDIRQYIRSKVMRKFKTGSIQVLVATDVAARGIDVNELNWVINYDLPQMPEVYVHRIGRTGRAQRTGVAISLCAPSQLKRLHAISRHTRGVIDIFNADGEQVTIEEARPAGGKSKKPGTRQGKPFGKRHARHGGSPRKGSGPRKGGGPRQRDEAPHRPVLEADTPPEEYVRGGSKTKPDGKKRKPFHRKGKPAKGQSDRPANKAKFGKSTKKPGEARTRKPNTRKLKSNPKRQRNVAARKQA